MAAAADIYSPELIELKELRSEDLAPVLEEEKLTWRTTLSWDFTASGDLVNRFLRMQALTGHALVLRDRVIGYSYYVSEDQKGLVGDLYVCRDFASTENEDRLLTAALQGLVSHAKLNRIEAQLMMLRGPFERKLPFAAHAHTFPRNFMIADLAGLDSPPAPSATPFTFDLWEEARQDEAALLIANTYHGHVDSSINDQYRSYVGARRFLTNIVQYPGCGSFYPAGSIIARHPEGRIAGLILTSLVAPDTGHITQICVAPDMQGQGLGLELLHRTLGIMKQNGCEKTSLTVTASNTGAIRLYQRIGFRAIRRFAAYVWEGF